MTDDQAFDIEYGYWYNAACERLYRRIDFGCNFIQLVGGSASAAAAFGGRADLVVAAGLLLACAAAIAMTVQPAVKAERHERAKCTFLAIKRCRSGADEAALHEAIVDAQSSGPVGVGALGMPAYNDAVRAMGREYGVRPLRWWEHFVAFMA